MKTMSIKLSGNGKRIEFLKMPNGGLEIYQHGLIRIPDGFDGCRGPHRCTDLDESLFHLGPEETKKLMDFLKD